MTKNKRGELSTQQIILLIILITSFVVVLFFLLRLNLGGESEKELCHNSVMMKASVLSSEAIPLKCGRSYVCITKDGTCEGIPDKKIKVKSLDEIYEALANEMADCWWMFGEGKVDYIGKDFFKKDNYCSICSQIYFDDSLKEIKHGKEEELEEIQKGNISKDELYSYLGEAEYSEGETYAEYLFRTTDLNKFKTTFDAKTFGNIEIGDQQYWVIMGIRSEVKGRAWKIAAGGVAAGLAYLACVPTLGAGCVLGAAIVGAIIVGAGEFGAGINPEIGAIIVEGDGIENSFMAPTVIKADKEDFDELGCYEIVTYT